MKKQKEITVNIAFTEGWDTRFTKAAFNLYKRIEEKNKKGVIQ